eukprot:5105459-Lingulodinium_polyedra.AAC.1
MLAAAGTLAPPLPQMGRSLPRGLRLEGDIRSAPAKLRTRVTGESLTTAVGPRRMANQAAWLTMGRTLS